MYIADCSFKLTHQDGLIILPADTASEYQGELRVTFQPKAYYPPEPDNGAGADFEASIRKIEIRDIEDEGKQPWHTLDPRDKARAEAFLEAHFRDGMWEQAFEETAEAFGAVYHRRAA